MKELEERGIGRPSTYAAVIETIQARSYVWRKGTALVPAWTAFAVTNLLERHFGHLVDYSFTATMEEALDVIARGEGEAEKWLHSFYYGNGQPGLHELVSDEQLALINRGVSTIPIGTDDTGHEIIVRVGRYGPYVQREDDETASLPPDIAPDELTVALALDLIAKQSEGPRNLGTDPDDRAAGVRAHGPVRTVRAARRAAGRHEEEAQARVAVRVDDARDGDARRGVAAPEPAPRRRNRRRRPRDRRVARPVRSVPEALRRRHPQPRGRGPAVHGHARRGGGVVRAAEDAARPPAEASARRARARTPTTGSRCACSKVATACTSPTAP